ncbi:DoxX family membrane protein [Mucilaginibacter sp. HMF7410]|uniref:DoxX family membrane protein n=2 Tax=Mucilaginibacter arboris TaxID=2682090 RepID=A0A7K1T0A5_9SPHI|nr:DoxX family membrane protein [Mucilaginibacter arboris]
MVSWKVRNGLTILRIALGIIFFWFGILKFFHGLSPAEELASRTIYKLTFGLVPPGISVYVLATWETLIGIGLLTGWLLDTTLLLLYFQMAGTFLPMLFFPNEIFAHSVFIPTMEGQYIIKNLVLISAGIVIGSTVKGAGIIAGPDARNLAEKYNSRFFTKQQLAESTPLELIPENGLE